MFNEQYQFFTSKNVTVTAEERVITFTTESQQNKLLKVAMTSKIFFSPFYQNDMPELIGKGFLWNLGRFPHVFAFQKVRF